MKNNLLTIYYITFINVFFDNVFKEIHIYNDIKKLIKILLIQMIYANILKLMNRIRKNIISDQNIIVFLKI